jgi:ectoine hydroxylase-related dioxygenase (phytanoyl-CoA dioxygenase family)
MTDFSSYGIKHINVAHDDVEHHIEALRLIGYTVVTSAWQAADLQNFSDRLETIYTGQAQAVGGVDILRRIGEANTVRLPLAEDDVFLAVAACPVVLEIARRMMDGYMVLNQQNGVINPAQGTHHQASFHRDLPYQHFTSSAPIGINALLCLDPFRNDNGATWVLPASHHWDMCPSTETIQKLAVQITAPAGSYLVMDAMVFHGAGSNRSAAPRRGINHLYTRGFVRQQIDIPTALGGRYADDPAYAQLLGYKDRAPVSALDWHRRRLARIVD